jgi:hypothetical protein
LAIEAALTDRLLLYLENRKTESPQTWAELRVIHRWCRAGVVAINELAGLAPRSQKGTKIEKKFHNSFV